MHTIAAKAVAFHEALQPEFKDYAAQVVKNAAVLADELKKRGFQLVTGGTSNHLILADVYKSFGVDGKTVEIALDKIGLTLNANSVPNDPLPPFKPSGIRLGTPALTTRGLRESDMVHIAQWIRSAVDAYDSENALNDIRTKVKQGLGMFPQSR